MSGGAYVLHSRPHLKILWHGEDDPVWGNEKDKKEKEGRRSDVIT